MKNLLLSCFAVLVFLPIYSQQIDSLKILRENDWRTVGNWFDKDTVYLKSIPKIDTAYAGLTIKEKYRKKRRNLYGERIGFTSGKLSYSNNMYCPVGETFRKVNAMEFKGDRLFVDYEMVAWPWTKRERVFDTVTYNIIRWTSEGIVIKR